MQSKQWAPYCNSPVSNRTRIYAAFPIPLMKGFIGRFQTAVCVQEVFQMSIGTLRKALEHTTLVPGHQLEHSIWRSSFWCFCLSCQPFHPQLTKHWPPTGVLWLQGASSWHLVQPRLGSLCWNGAHWGLVVVSETLVRWKKLLLSSSASAVKCCLNKNKAKSNQKALNVHVSCCDSQLHTRSNKYYNFF